MPRIFSPQQIRANRLLWAAVLGATIIEMAALYFLHLKLDAPATKGAFVIITASLAGTLFYRFYRRDDGLSLFASVLPFLIVGGFAIENATYLAAYMSFPLVDKPLVAVDAAMGFDWREYVFWINRHPQIAWLLDNAYGSCNLQFIVLLPLLFIRAPAQGQRLFIALYTSGILCAIIGGFFPAVGAYGYYDIKADALPTMPATARIQEPLFNALLHHTIDVIPYPGAGIVQFPSFHSAVAVLLIYGAWSYRILRVIALPLTLRSWHPHRLMADITSATQLVGLSLPSWGCCLPNACCPDI